ncbi:E3 ubiquitin-protein ligase Ubr3 isoform X2 [Condylostylus longicornis]|uniref:E3 ubiquitin-protein ligase Ubr3 isoform X2 n=1 Tax=Condylostylus longicornis TaxID=2530218 RepID=UPI00244E1EDB|nr:E3 ubiquitin-protein ligase Ubr3 isoform X2 [Condylostylus longicornis]
MNVDNDDEQNNSAEASNSSGLAEQPITTEVTTASTTSTHASAKDENLIGIAEDTIEVGDETGDTEFPGDFSDDESVASRAKKILEKGKEQAAAYINEECCRGGPTPELNVLIDYLFSMGIDSYFSIDWVRYLIAGGRSLGKFASIVRSYDNHAKCGLVWVPHVVAYRCRTCGISPCMSICRDCFKKGDHANHDFNMFLSQAGGACDCGDTSVMKAEGFCSDHGINNRANKDPVPNDLLAVAEAIMPKLLFRLLHHFREHSSTSHQHSSINVAAGRFEKFCNMLMDYNNMGELMRRVMTKALINPEVYKKFSEKPFPNNSYGRFLKSSKKKYIEAVYKFPRLEPPDEYKHLPALDRTLKHSTLLEEFIFWTFKFEFPQNLVCFLLNMLPDQDYKEHLTRTFVMHYSRIPTVLELSQDPDTLSNRVVHMSVQLFSNESLALKMVEELSLLHVMIISLKLMMSKILIQNSLHGMNVNVRETKSHVEFEPSSYYAAFSCELEASAYPMWSIISHLKDPTHAQLAKKILTFCVNSLHEWLDAIFFLKPKLEKSEMMTASFHFPLHRYLAAFTCQAVTSMGMSLSEILPSPDLLTLLMAHPLRVQSFFYEILAGIWIRNGLQIKGQAMTYIQANFCNSMVDMDLFFLQICATQLPASVFLTTTIDSFGVSDWLGMSPLSTPQEMEQDSMLEGFLTFLATLATSRTNLGNDERTQCIIEISALLATENKTHSQLLELMPERSGNVHTKNFEKFLKQLSVYKAPASRSENLEQGLFMPIDEVWEHFYDPLHVLLRAVHRRDFQSSMDRFGNYVKSKNKMPKSGNLWPPFRLPRPVGEQFSDPCCILNSRVFHSTILAILHRAVNSHNISEHLLALAVFLLEIAVENSDNLKTNKDTISECERNTSGGYYSRSSRDAPELLQCYPTDNLFENLRFNVHKVSLKPQEPQVTPSYNTNNFDSDQEWDVSESETLPMIVGHDMLPPASSGMEVAIPQDLSIVSEQSLVIRSNSQEEDVSEDGSMHGGSGGTVIVEATTPTEENISSEGTVASNSENRNSTNRFDSMELQTINNIASHFALQTIALPESGMEVAIRRELGLESTNHQHTNVRQPPSTHQTEMFSPTSNNVMLLPFQRVQPVAIPSRNLDVVPTHGNRVISSTMAAGGSRNSNIGSGINISGGCTNRKRAIENAFSIDSDTVFLDESILSLLLKLHSQLSGTLDSFSLEDYFYDKNENDESNFNEESASTSMDVDSEEAGPSSSIRNDESILENKSSRQNNRIKVSESRVGDGPYFIGNLLRKIAKRNEACAQNIDLIRQRLWPNQREKQAEQKAREAKEKEERGKRARERQQELLAEFANKQKQFMKMAAENMDIGEEIEDDEIEQPREKEYDCIICNRTSASTETNPIGLVVLVESSGVVGHRRKSEERLKLPLSSSEADELMLSTRLATEFNRRTVILGMKFGEDSWYLSNNLAYETGIHVQSCGHHVHLTCLDAYLNSLYPTQRQNLHVERGEFYCPVCRQLSNSVLPLSPQLDRLTPIIRSGQHSYEQLVSELTNLIKENEKPPPTTKLSEAMGRAMEDMTNITHRKQKRVPPTFRSLFLFVTSIARTNLEAEIIQRGGSLCTNNTIRYKPKRECIVPLLHVLSVHIRVLVVWPLWRSWALLAGLPIFDSAPVPSHCKEFIPSLLADPIALLIKFILLAPLHLDQVYFTCIVKAMYNLLYYQVVVQLCTTLTDLECDEIIEKYSNKSNYIKTTGVKNLGAALAFVLSNTDRLKQLRRESVQSSTANSSIHLGTMEQNLQKLCLPFLRIAALLRHHLYRQELPEIATPQLEFVRLVYFLELVTESMDWDCFNASKALCFILGTEQTLPKFWCEQLLSETPPPTDTIRELVMNQHLDWHQPKLLKLPKEYERLFTYYHESACLSCLQVPKESSICLLCGTIVCLKQQCCAVGECCEAVRHAINCGGGIGIFLVVTSTYIIVIRGRRACLWGSLYLDDFDEEDRDLKRGKPLYLSEDRFNLLESQWLSHRFAHTKHTWVFHRDLL